jgi:hypothetical protein
MRNRFLNGFFSIIMAPFMFLLHSCTPLGKPVDSKISKSYFYSKNKKYIIFSTHGNWFELGKTPMKNVDMESFELVSELFAKDKNNVYFKGQPLKEKVDLPSFKIVNNSSLMAHYPVDKNYVYHVSGLLDYELQIIEGADPLTFHNIDLLWAKDAKHIFYKDKITPLNINSFEILNGYFCKDAENVYLSDDFLTKIESDAPSTVDFNKDNIIYDKNHLFALTQYYKYEKNTELDVFEWIAKKKLHRIEYKNIRTLKNLAYGSYILVDDKVFICSDETLEFPASSFKKLGEDNSPFAIADEKIYFYGLLIPGVDLESFELVESPMANAYYSKDKNSVYFRNTVVSQADPKTFRYDPKTRQYIDSKNKYYDNRISPQ